MAATDIHWECDVPIVTNPLVMRQLAFVFGLAPLLVVALLAIGLWGQGELDALLPIAGFIAASSAGLFLLGVLASFAIYRNRMHSHFKLTDEGFEAEVIDGRARSVGWLTFLIGLLASKPGAAGTGLLALSSNRRTGKWKAVAHTRFHDARRIVELRNGWRTIAVLFCVPDNYADVKAHIQARVRSNGKRRHPLGRALLWTMLVTLAALPTFKSGPPFDISLLAAMILLCFSVATVWFVPPLGYVVIGVGIWIMAEMLLSAFEIRDSMFTGERRFPAYQIASGDDWARLVLILAGFAYLYWFAWRTLRGKYTPVLLGDEIEMDDGG